MRSSRSPFGRALLIAGACGVSTVALFACVLGDFNVLPKVGDAGVTATDSSTPVQEGGPMPEGGVDDAAKEAEAGPGKTHCDTVMPAMGVVNFLCADFDSQLFGNGFDDIIKMNNGTLEKTTDVSVSMPFSLASNAKGIGSAGALGWKRNGTLRVTDAEAVFHINPLKFISTGSVSGLLELAQISTNNASVTIGYSRGSTRIMPTGQPYFGYYLNGSTITPAQSDYFPLPQLAEDTWSVVKLYWDSNGSYLVFVDGAKKESQSGIALSDTSITIRIGAFGQGDVGVIPLHRFDDVELSVRR